MKNFPNLFQPLDINGMILPNRTALTAMVTRLSGEDGFVNQDIIDRYMRFAAGEVGLMVVEASAIHGAKSGQLLRINDDEFITGHRDMVQQIHDSSPTKVALQIIHFLKIARSGWRQTVKMLDKDDIQAIIRQYGEAAVRTRDAGYDAVELHMAHAYTMSSFLSKRSNTRTDEYGGRSLETRMRMMTETVLKVRSMVGPDFPIGVRFDAEECIKDGYGLSESKYIGLRLAQLGVDYISLSAGGKFEDAVAAENEALYPYTGYSGDRAMPPATYQDGANVYMAAGIKAFINEHGFYTPVITTGKISTPQMAESILQNGQADMVGFARALLADPDFPKKARLGEPDKIVRCIYGNVCKQLDEKFKKVTCTLWLRHGLNVPMADPADVEGPTWPTNGSVKAVLRPNGRVRVEWEKAADEHGMHGYEVFRAVNAGPYEHLSSSSTNRYTDQNALAGNNYTYMIKAYDFAGNRSVASEPASVEIPLPVMIGEDALRINHSS
ncbi:MAG: 2,4-dienoyl-CoA reductase-like NADH-dependent reductase (Old Yellow Enzyme family) [Cellvibrionaceae bacterium]|jgi:2,4-dienoyl-CoA reductase-like NADH-dependent reductase (Old Yellow Enzyme family)